MTLYEVLTTMQDVRIELHIFEKFGKDGMREVEKIEESRNNTIFVNMSLNRYNNKYDMNKLDVFYIGYRSPRSRVLRINVNIRED